MRALTARIDYRLGRYCEGLCSGSRCALATSASYAENSGYNASGVVLDPRANDCVVAGRSASVRASTCAVADALAKCVLILGEASAPLLCHFQAQGFLIEDNMSKLIDTDPVAVGEPKLGASQYAASGAGANEVESSEIESSKTGTAFAIGQREATCVDSGSVMP